ncbi:two-component system sensor histidine kinase PhoR [Aliidiomarina taiwanensis]|uniref:Phosphate regulon sensor protein PhoR n=1 Tax=Aliidiomarina taiwanensis TaxID=946228 RepID=A0A432X1G4_9GAMM|nr:phosphate regulon sensor histidine kinase PhoR [Aliidiomarina taiwanensis]RUO40126.1 two-component system sensor histidine kinase PhoR [Aliidiomarina taiwanensis]
MDRYYTPLKAITVFTLGLLFAGGLGWLLGYPQEFLLLYLAVLVVWNGYYLLKLSHWFWNSKSTSLPQASGIWSDIYDGLYRTQKRHYTRRKKLAALLQRFRQAAESLPDAGLVIDGEGQLIWSNKLAQQYLGLKWPMDKGVKITHLIRSPSFIKYFQQQNFDEAITLYSPTGDKREIELRIMPYVDTQYLILARDVTHIRKLERMRKEFVANVSHELKTPLTVMQGYLELLEEPEGLAPQQQTQALSEVTRQTQRMQAMVEQLLMLSRIESKHQDVPQEPVVLGSTIHNLLSELALVIESEQVHVSAHIDETLTVLGSPERLHAVVHNLLTNAIKYSGEGARIYIEWQAQEGQAHFRIQDTGPGIAPEHLARLTERFYRVAADRNSRSGGTGLGLAIVKHALEAHHSQLHIDSTEGEGSCFSFSLPKINSDCHKSDIQAT